MAAPRVLSRKANGNPLTAKPKASSRGEKVVIRRLPPGMREEELVKILGNDWNLGGGRVDWFEFEPGKIATDPAKISRAARAYLHLTDQDDLPALTEAVRVGVWEDAKVSWNDAALIGPPYVEVCMYKKVPTDKKRTDSRQGTIDSDPAFKAFLESLTQSDAKKETEPEHMVDETPKNEKVTTTPLVEYLKEKRAAKAKDAAAAKSAKLARQESLAKAKAEELKKKAKEAKEAKDKPKEKVQILTKKAATETAAEAAKAVASQLQTAAASIEPAAAAKSRRAGIAAAARILQRDLGLSPGNAHRKARQDAANESKADVKEDEASVVEAASPAMPVQVQKGAPSPTSSASGCATSRGRNKKRGAGDEPSKNKAEQAKTPVILEHDEAVEHEPTPTAGESSSCAPAPKILAKGKATLAPNKKTPNSAPTPTPGATRAFVKHANPSQGVTELLLKDAMQAFGRVGFVEIDRRKGYAYVDFADADGLACAMAASPVTVAQATVHVLERKDAMGAAGKKPVGPKQANGEPNGLASPPSGPAADKTTPAQDKEKDRRAGRRRGGRGRDRDRDGGAKDSELGGTGGTGGTGAAASSPVPGQAASRA